MQSELTKSPHLGNNVPSAAMSVQLTPAVLARHTILYVDDNDWSRSLFARTVQEFVSVDLADSGKQALQMLKQRSYSIVVTDLRMPDMDGIELCAQVREQFPKVRRILVTAYGDLTIATNAINRGGVSQLLTKPWKAEVLNHVIKEILTRVELERTVESLQENLKRREVELALGEQFGRVVHDLSSIPLPIRTSLLDLQQVCDDPELPSASRGLIEQQCTTLGLVIDHIENILRRSQDLEISPPRRRRYHVLTALETARSLVVNHHDATKVELVCDTPELEFLADLTDVTRVLVNLMKNSMHAVTGHPDGRITVKAYAEGPETVIEVIDNGPGVPSALREAIFRRGYTKRKHLGGRGLGLTICRDLTTMNDGSLYLEKSEERGCRFVLRLPAPAAEQACSLTGSAS